MAQAKRDPKIDNRIVQWDDLPKEGQAIAATNMRSMGESMPERVQTSIESAKRSKQTKSKQTQASLEAIAPHVTREPVTLQCAANSRQRLYRDAQIRKQETDPNPDNVLPDGSDWYFEHNARIAHAADQVGYPREWAQGASAVMSPQNAPENERAAVKALMEGTATGKVHVTPEVVAHLASRKKNPVDVSQHVGKVVHIADLPPGALAHLSDKESRTRVSTDANLREVARGGTKENIVKAERVLSGEITPEQAVVNDDGAISAAKVGSYSHVIRASGPGSAVHVEFMGQQHQDALARANGGGSGRIPPVLHGPEEQHEARLRGGGKRYADYDEGMDLYGLQAQAHPREHLLSPKSHTVEDTWQNAVTFNQPKELVGEGNNKTSVFKAGGSGDQYSAGGLKTQRDAEGKQTGSVYPEDSRVTDGMVLHAFNNKATQKAAAQQGRNTGSVIPPVGMQGVDWTEARRQAGKGREGGESGRRDQEMSHEDYQTEVDVFRRMGRTVPQTTREQEAPRPSKFQEQYGDHVRGQMALFGDDVPGGGRRRPAVRDDAENLTDSEKEADLRKWAAIGDATRKSRKRRQSVQE